ncbi:MAG TPA: M24 family metallopeptidase [Pyrinomonadaceae bacterium]|nr:M24 family metallopeptidase [Pyrinomonadaceae bacterium]
MLELDEKTGRLRRMLEAESLNGVLINTQHNFSWLSCGGSNGIDLSRENGAGFLFVTKEGRRFVVANNIEMSRLLAEELPRDSGFEPVQIAWQAEKDPQNILHAIRSIAGGDEIGCDIPFPETRNVEWPIANCRFQMTPDEIERFRQLGADAGSALDDVIPRLDPGQTEKLVARQVRDELAAHDIYPVVTLVAGDDRIANYRHPVPTDNVWRNTLMIVVCARRHGLVASLTRIVCAGEVPSELQHRTEAAAAVNAAFYSGTVEGAVGSELYQRAAEAYAAQGFADEINKHHQGGACGYRTRDWVAHPTGGEIVLLNQAFAWNPSITGTKTEETGILTENGFEVITASNSFPKIMNVVDGREYFSPGILSLSKGARA